MGAERLRNQILEHKLDQIRRQMAIQDADMRELLEVHGFDEAEMRDAEQELTEALGQPPPEAAATQTLAPLCGVVLRA